MYKQCFIFERRRLLSTFKCYFLKINITNNNHCKEYSYEFVNIIDATARTQCERKFVRQQEKYFLVEQKEIGE